MKYFSSRRREIFLAWIFVLHRDVVISVSGGNFAPIYHPEIDGIPSRSQNPTAKRLTVGCYFKEVVFRKGVVSKFFDLEGIALSSTAYAFMQYVNY